MKRLTLFTTLALLTLASGASAEVKLHNMFSSNMVLQQDTPVPIWGTAEPGEEVTLTFRTQTKTIKAGEDGKWMLTLDKLQLGEPGELTVKGSSNDITLTNVLVGEVWLGSGQSNMAGGAGGYAKNDKVLAGYLSSGPYPEIRLYNKGAWAVADENTMKAFSAIHLSFGYALHKELKVPVGLMYGAVGGTPSGRWLSTDMALADKGLVDMFTKSNGFPPSEIQKRYDEQLAEHNALVEKLKAEGKQAPKMRGVKGFGDLYAKHIEYMAPYAIRGVLWDQGESKTQIPGVDQYTTMNALINGWRKVWGQGDFPFLHIQKPSGGGASFDPENPVNTGAVKFNNSLPASPGTKPMSMKYPLDHIRMGTIKNAPLVPAIDLGIGIHPACKSGYGTRACRVALGTVYGKDIATSGPVYKSHTVEGNKVRVQFDHVGQGLVVKHSDTLQGFAIAGADGKWTWADAVIDGDSIVLTSADVPEPLHVQYAFSNRPDYANLYNKDGLPALTFTSVKWED
jgi:sialate O-acetylesterase